MAIIEFQQAFDSYITSEKGLDHAGYPHLTVTPGEHTPKAPGGHSKRKMSPTQSRAGSGSYKRRMTAPLCSTTIANDHDTHIQSAVSLPTSIPASVPGVSEPISTGILINESIFRGFRDHSFGLLQLLSGTPISVTFNARLFWRQIVLDQSATRKFDVLVDWPQDLSVHGEATSFMSKIRDVVRIEAIHPSRRTVFVHWKMLVVLDRDGQIGLSTFPELARACLVHHYNQMRLYVCGQATWEKTIAEFLQVSG